MSLSSRRPFARSRPLPSCILVLLALPTAAPDLAAQEEDEESREGPVPVDTLYVQGLQSEMSISMTAVTADEMEGRHASLAYDALDAHPGLHVPRRMGFSGTGLTRLAVRGAGSAGPAGLPTFVDGRADPSVSFAHPIPQSHIAEDVRRIEVIRGPSPVLHGQGNTGVMNVRTADPDEGWSARARTSTGSFGSLETYAAGSYGWESGHARVSGTYRETDGHLEGTDAEIRSGRAEVAQELAGDWRVTLSGGRTRDRFSSHGPIAVPGPFGSPGTTELALTHTFADLDVEGPVGRSVVSVQVGGNTLDPRSQAVPEGTERADVWDGMSRMSVTLAPWNLDRLVLGLDVLHASARNTPAGPDDLDEMDVSLTEVGPYVFAEHRPSPHFKLNGGVRLTQHSEYGTEPSGELGLIVNPAGADEDALLHGTAVRARATRGFQSPTLQQLFGVFLGGPAGPANPDLEPENVNQLELGVNQRIGTFELDLVGFEQRGRDLIVPVQGQLGNVGEFEHRGVEVSARGRITEALMIRSGLTIYDLSEGVLRVPHRTVDAGVTYQPSLYRPRDLSLGFVGRYASRIWDEPWEGEEDIPVRLDDYATFDLRAAYRFPAGIETFVTLRNLTDEDYETVWGIPMPGRNVQAGVSVAF